MSTNLFIKPLITKKALPKNLKNILERKYGFPIEAKYTSDGYYPSLDIDYLHGLYDAGVEGVKEILDLMESEIDFILDIE